MKFCFLYNRVIFFMFMFYKIESYSYLVPQESCYSMIPSHNSTKEETYAPYNLIIENKYFSPFQKIKGWLPKTKFELII